MVIFLIILLASMVLPSLVAVIKSQDAAAFRLGVVSLMQQARKEAIQQNRAMTVRFDGDALGYQVAQGDEREDDATPQLGTAADENIALSGRLRPYPGTRFTAFEISRESVAQDEFQVTFYPDGSADRAFMQFEIDEQAYLLSVDPMLGLTRLRPGRLEEVEDTTWEAGELERRVG